MYLPGSFTFSSCLKLTGAIFSSCYHSFELKCIQDNTHHIHKDHIIAFVTLRNEAFRIKYFLEYYRKLGVKHFIFIDNASTDGFQEIVKQTSDCSVWYTKASYKQSKFGIHWINHMLRRFGVNHWCLVVDPDEFMVIPLQRTKNLLDLTKQLDKKNQSSFFTLLLDMYADKKVTETVCLPGQNPLEVAPYFDKDGYTREIHPQRGDMLVQGGPRRRVMFQDQPAKSPALNKIPLIHWKWHYSYLSSTHYAIPRHLNLPHLADKAAPTGCLLHFKFLSVLKNKAPEEVARKEHFNNAAEYKTYVDFMQTEEDILYSKKISVKYTGCEQLTALGLMRKGS